MFGFLNVRDLLILGDAPRPYKLKLNKFWIQHILQVGAIRGAKGNCSFNSVEIKFKI